MDRRLQPDVYAGGSADKNISGKYTVHGRYDGRVCQAAFPGAGACDGGHACGWGGADVPRLYFRDIKEKMARTSCHACDSSDLRHLSYEPVKVLYNSTAWLYAGICGSIFCSMLMHFCNNLVAVVVMKYSEQASRAVPILTKSSYVLSDYLLLVGVACIGLGLGWFLLKKTGIKKQ